MRSHAHEQVSEMSYGTIEDKDKTDSPKTTAPRDISLVRGGLLYRFLMLIRVMDDGHWNIGRRVAFVLAVLWVPVVVIRLINHPDRVMQLILD